MDYLADSNKTAKVILVVVLCELQRLYEKHICAKPQQLQLLLSTPSPLKNKVY
jgi:hypothetical protein